MKPRIGSLRPECPDDAIAIEGVTRRAFASHPHSRQTEHFVVRALRKADALTISLMAELSSRVVGHIAFSPVSISDGSALPQGEVTFHAAFSAEG